MEEPSSVLRDTGEQKYLSSGATGVSVLSKEAQLHLGRKLPFLPVS